MGNLSSRPSDQQTRSRNTWDLRQNIENRRKKIASSDKAKATGHTAWATLETTLRLLETSSDAFPPLKSALAGVIGCLDIIQAAAGNDQDYADLASQFAGMAKTLNQYMSELDPAEANSDQITGIIQSIDTQVSHIAQKRGRGKGKRLVESRKDQGDVINCYKVIEGLFRDLQNDIGLRTLSGVKNLREMLLLGGLSGVRDAEYNSTIKRRGCTANTRVKVQEDLQKWVQDSNGAKVFWMSGMTGTGKTTLAYSLCEWLEKNNQLGASFFCSRSEPYNDLKKIVPTIACQLATQLAPFSPPFRSELRRAFDKNRNIGDKDIKLQFKALLEDLLSKVKAELFKGVVVVIDALDECKGEEEVLELLKTLLEFAPKLPLKFFVTSRPEFAIHNKMTSPGGTPRALMRLDDVEQDLVEEDINKYLTEALSSMEPSPTYTKRQIKQLAQSSGGLFIYAATVVRYIHTDYVPVGYSTSRLKALLSTESERREEASSDQFKKLGELYAIVLKTAFEKLRENESENMRRVLWTAVCAREPMTVETMELVLKLKDQILPGLQLLRSVLHVSEGSKVVSVLHASFSDYLLDRSRSGSEKFHCDEPEYSELLARRCFEVMEALQFNICNLKSSFALDKDVQGLDEKVERAVSPFFYACRYWGEHLQRAPVPVPVPVPVPAAPAPLPTLLAEFLSQRLLFWMEVLNLKMCIGAGAEMLLQVQKWLSKNSGLGDIQKQTGDACNFVATFAASPCSQSTPHIYISALPLCPKSSLVYKSYWKRTRGLMDLKGTIIDGREEAALAVWEGGGIINQAAFSPKGNRIVTAEGKSVWVRDSQTGAVVTGPFKGHESRVMSVAFSPDGTFIASGSYDCTIRVWDLQTGSIAAGPFKGHTGEVTSVAFSPDGTRIVSGSSDYTVRVWYSETGFTAAGPFKGHERGITSVGFSPDGTRIVSGSYDHTIRVWPLQPDSAAARSFEHHTSPVMSVGFSTDGSRIVSASADYAIQVWDSETGFAVAGPFEGHTEPVTSIAFSRDSTRIVSGSFDKTVRVWPLQPGSAVARSFQGHTSPVTSVAFSPDGTRIVSCSGDNTIRVWNSQAGFFAAHPFHGHTKEVTSVAFSPDGTRIVSGSADKTIQVWDSRTGSATVSPFQGHTQGVTSVAFSPDGGRIVSGSHDNTIQVWDSRTGSAAASPFQGHTQGVTSVAFSPDGSRIVSGSYDNTIRVRPLQLDSTAAGPFQGHTESVASVPISPEGICIDSGYYDNATQVRPLQPSSTAAGRFPVRAKWVGPVASPPDSSRIASGSSDRTIPMWDPWTGSAANPFQGHTEGVKPIAFSPDSSRIVSGTNDHIIPMWGSEMPVVPRPFGPHRKQVTSVAFSPNGTRIASGSSDNTIRVWYSETGSTAAGPFKGHTGEVTSVAFSRDGNRIVSGSRDKTIRVWDSNTGPTATSPFEGHEGEVTSVAFSPDGTRIVSGSDDCTILVWDSQTGSAAAGPFKGHVYSVTSVAFSPDGNRIVSGSADCTIRVWDLPTIFGRAQAEPTEFTVAGRWFINNDGWVVKNDKILFWAPPDIRKFFPRHPAILVISDQGCIGIEHWDLKFGDRWDKCFV